MRKNRMVGWKRVLCVTLSLMMVLSMIDIAPGSGYALASEWEGDSAPVEEDVETTEPPALVEESGSPSDTAEAEITPTTEPDATPEETAAEDVAETSEVTPTAEPTVTPEVTTAPEETAAEDVAETPEITATAEPTVTPEVTIAPEETAAEDVAETPEVTATAEPTVTPEVTTAPEETAPEDVAETPEVTATAEPTVTPEVTDVPEVTDTPEPEESPALTEIPAPLMVSLSSDVRSAFADEDAIVVSLRIEGGMPEYTIAYQISLDGTAVETSVPLVTMESKDSYAYMARSFGVHTITVTVTDACGQTGAASVFVPVAVRDTTSAAEQRRRAESVQLTGDWRRDMLAVAASQLGYQESETDFTMLEDGSIQGYTVYGDWYGAPYEQWSAMFIAYCAHYAKVPEAYVPRTASLQQLLNAANGKGAYFTRASGYEPEAGDIVFLNDGTGLHCAGLVEAVTDGEIRAIVGNHSRSVARVSYSRNDNLITGYASTRALMAQAGVLAEEDEPERAVEEAQAMIDALPGVGSLAAAREQLRAAYEVYKSLTAEQRAQLTGADVLKDILDVENLISELPDAAALPEMDIDSQLAAYEQTQAAYDAYMALTEEQRELVAGAEVFEALFAFFNDQIMPLDGYSGGEGTADNPYEISKPEDMWALADNTDDWNKHFVLTTDIDLDASEEKQWSPIGSSSKGAVAFSGSFDGKNHTISGLYIKNKEDYQGLFGYVTDGTISNLKVNGYISACGNEGGIVGALNPIKADGGRIENCSFAGSIVAEYIDGSDTSNGGIVGYNHNGKVIDCRNSATIGCQTQFVGGIVGQNSGTTATVENCSNTGNVTIYGTNASYAGGIVGVNNTSAKIINCNNSGKVDGAGSAGVIGGIAGSSAGGSISQSHNDGAVTGGKAVGGIAGQLNAGTISQCYNIGAVTGSDQIGGVVGTSTSKATLEECYNTAQVSGTGMVGGIAGANDEKATVTNCYNEGNVSGYNVGGIVGQNYGGPAKNPTVGTVANCYSRGTVTGKNIGSIVGSNGTTAKSGTVTNCYYLTGNVGGINGSEASGQAEEKTEAQFASGEVAWLLQHGQSALTWGQELVKEQKDPYPLLPHTGVGVGRPQVLKVIFRTRTVENCQMTYSNNGGEVAQPSSNPETDENHAFYEWRIGDENGQRYDGTVHGSESVTDDEVIIVAVQRETFGGEDEENVIRVIYGVGVRQNLDAWVGYATGMTSTADKFDYKLEGNAINAVMEGNVLTVPATTNVNEQGYELTVTAHEKQPQVSPLSIGSYGTVDVTLRIRVIISKATPKISVAADAIDYGHPLSDSTLSGTATHPTTDDVVPGEFTWDVPGTIPNVIDAAKVGYPVTFRPVDTVNYNTVSTTVTLKVNKVEPECVPPTPNDSTYTGQVQSLIIPGSTSDGTMKYRLDGDENDYSSTIPERANAGTYTVWYKVFGDDNHNDTEEKSVTVIIAPYPLIIENQSFTYNGKKDLTVTVPGVGDETVTVTLTAGSKNVATYTYADEAGEGSYTTVIAAPNNTNYAVANGSGTLTITELPVQLQWSEKLSFVYDAKVKTVTAEVINGIDGDGFNLSYEDNIANNLTNKATNVGDYVAKVIRLGNNNYTLDNVQNASQVWHITKEEKKIALEPVEPIFYGDQLTLTATISSTSGIIEETDTVEFYINGFFIDKRGVVVEDDVGTATMRIDHATSALHFAADNNTASVKYSGNANEKEAQSDAITILVNPKPITASILGDTPVKTYDGDDIAVGLELGLIGLEECDEKQVTATAKSYTYNSKDVKDAKTITANEIELSGIRSGNYVLDTDNPVEIGGKIQPRTVKLEWRGVNGLVYSGNPANVTATATGLVSGDVVNVTVSNGTETDAATTYTAKAIALTGENGEPNHNYALPKDGSAEQEYIIDPAPLLISPMTVIYNGDREFSAEENGVTPDNGVVEKVAVTLTASEANAGEYAFSADEAEGSVYTATTEDTNYTITNGATLTIEKAVPNVTWPVFNGTVYVNDDPPTAAYFTPGSATGVDGQNLLGAFTLDGAMRWMKSGTEEVMFTFTPDDTTNYISVTNEHVAVRVDKRQVASVDDQTPILDKVYGTEKEQLGLPDSVTITTADGKKFYGVRVTWTGYDPESLEEQNLIGTLDLSGIEDEVENPKGVQASIEVTLQPLMPGAVEYSDKTVIYSGMAVTHEIAGGIEGVTGVTYEYAGLEGTAYGPSADGPTDAGMYTVTATFAMEAGYKRLEDVTVRLVINPAALTIPEQSFTYQGSDAFKVALNGVNGETVDATLTAYRKDVGSYAYATETGESLYTARLSSANYTVEEGGTLTITPRAAVLTWKEPLSFAYDGQMHEVTAEVSNAVRGDTFSLTYADNTGVDEGSYTARVTELGNQNYTLTDAQNVTQVWRITQGAAKVTLTVAELVTYGDQLTLTATIAKAETNGIALMALDPDTVQFYANGVLLDNVGVKYEGTSKDSGTASLTINATSANHLPTGVNELKAVYSGNSNMLGGEAAVSVSVAAKTIRGRMAGDTVKTYDGLDSATGLNIELDGVEECDQGQVTATAGQYTYDSADAGNDKTITARDVVLVGAQSGNYRLETASVTAAGVINPKVVGLEWSGYTNLVYTGKPVNVTATATGLISGDECGVVVENGRQSEVGNYTATATGLTNPNYALPSTGTTQEYTITGTDTNDPSNTDGPGDPSNTDGPGDPNNTNSPNSTDAPDGPSSTKKPGNSSEGTDTAGGTQGSNPPPKTGDNSMLTMWVLLMVLSFCGIAAVLAWNAYTNRKSKR